MRNLLMLLRLHVVAALLLLANSSIAQSGGTTEGREFWLGFMPNADIPAQSIQIIVASRYDNKVKVETYGAGGSIVKTQTASMTAGQRYVFEMSVPLSETRAQEKADYKAIRVTSTSPCTVHGLSDNNLSTEGFLALPIGGLGQEYYCLSYYDDNYYYLGPSSHLGGEFLVVAPYDNTELTITTTASTTTSEDGYTISRKPGDTWKVTLQSGQTYLVQTTGRNWAVDDLTGSHVTSSRPIAFLSGHQRAQIETTADNSKDHLIEMLPPVEYWGTEYISAPQRGRKAGNYYRILSAEDDNAITADTVQVTLDRGEWIGLSEMTRAVHFTSSSKKKFIVAEYAYHQNYEGDPSLGEPFMITLTPLSGMVMSATFATPQNQGSAYKWMACMVTTPTGLSSATIRDALDVKLPISSLSPTVYPIAGTNWVAAVFQFSGVSAAKTVESSSPFAFHFYGNTQTESYAAPAARSFASGDIDSIRPKFTFKSIDSCGRVVAEARDSRGIETVDIITESAPLIYGTYAYTYNYDVQLDPAFQPGDTVVTLTAQPVDSRKHAELALWAVDRWGNDTVLITYYSARPFGSSLLSPIPITRTGDTSCTAVVVRNEDDRAMRFNSSELILGTHFSIQAASDTLLQPGDSAIFTLCFTPEHSTVYLDTLLVSNACGVLKVPLRAESAIPKIYATDLFFGNVPAGDSICRWVTITNESDVPVTITGYEVVGDTVFNVMTPLPITIPPEEDEHILVCFTALPGKDSSSGAMTWITQPRSTTLKVYSILTGTSRELDVVRDIASGIRLWPNPASSVLNVLTPEGTVLHSARAIDVLGAAHELPFGPDGMSLDIRSLSRGSYTLLIQTNQGQLSIPFVIER